MTDDKGAGELPQLLRVRCDVCGKKRTNAWRGGIGWKVRGGSLTNKISFLRFEEGDYGESDSVIFIGDNGYSPDDYPIELLIEKINCAFEEELAKVRKAERERCAKIAEGYALPHDGSWECPSGMVIAKKIRGGQDGK